IGGTDGRDRRRAASFREEAARGSHVSELRQAPVEEMGPRLALGRDAEQRKFLLHASAGAGPCLAARDVLATGPRGASRAGAERETVLARVAALRAGGLFHRTAAGLLYAGTIPGRPHCRRDSVCGLCAGGAFSGCGRSEISS